MQSRADWIEKTPLLWDFCGSTFTSWSIQPNAPLTTFIISDRRITAPSKLGIELGK